MSIPVKKGNYVAWNPHNPASLLVPVTGEGKDGAFATNTFLSHDGVGCNDHERTALMDLLDAHDAYLESKSTPQALMSLSKSYRRALSNCLQGWEDELLAKQDASNAAAGTEESPSNLENLELLKVAYAVTHLSETFLLLPANDQVMDFYKSTTNLPGAVTAETVRYVRLHHMTEASEFLDDETLENLFASFQPEKWEETGEIYWKLLEKYVLRGNLEDAWGLLTRHSLCRRCTEAIAAASANDSNALALLDEYTAASLEEDREGLEALRAVLLSAPLPGGRTDQFDAALADDDDYRLNGGTNGEEYIDEDDPNYCYIEGIPLSSYRLWETSTKRRGKGDVPSTYNDQYSKQVYQSWKQAIKSIPALSKLCRRIPQLQKILDIISGDFSKVEFDSWADQFCAELLYKVPELRLVDIHIRALRVMEQHNDNSMSDGNSDGQSEFEQVVLSVMKGNSGRVIEVLHQLGGGSGAALPAVMTSLLCNLLDDAKILPEVSTSYSLRTELLLNAAFAIHSSLATEGHSDVATRLTTRFLVPHIKVDGDIRITATMVETLEHHYPKSDAEANALLGLCRSLVERKNVRVLDGCVSICLARYRYYLKDQRPGGAFHWLLVGMEFESLILGSTRNDTSSSRMMIDSSEKDMDANWQKPQVAGVCYRLLVNYCLGTTRGLLKAMLGEGDEGFAALHGQAKEMIATALEETDFSTFIRPARALENVLLIANAMAEDHDDTVVANNIVTLLEELADEEENGVVSSLAQFSMHWDLLRLAKGVLQRDADPQSEVRSQKGFKSSFDVHGVQVLLERFTIVAAEKDMEKAPLAPDETKGMRIALGEGLMRAFVVENANKRIHKRSSKPSIAGIYSADLGKHSREKQELVVASMLD